MVDFLGRELSIGDHVVALVHQRTSSTLYLAEIMKMTNKMIEVKAIRNEHDWRYDDIMRVSPYKVVKVTLEDEHEDD